MTISSNNRKAGPFIGNGSAATFPFTFKVFQASDLFVVRLTVSTGAQSTLVLGTDYTVTLNLEQDSNPGGSITLVAGALASGYNLIITSDIGNLQPTDLTNQGGFYPEVINDSLDRATIQIQQLQEQTDRTLKYPVTDPSTGTELPAVAQRAGKVLTFDELGAPIAGPSVDEVGTILDNLANITTVANDLNGPDTIGTVATNIADVNTVASNMADVNTVADNIADVGTVATNIADVIIAADNVADINNFADVYQGAKASDPTLRNNGSPLQPGDMYFNTSVNELRLYSGTVWVAGTAGTVAVQRFSGTGSQTTFTLTTAPSGENNTQVYINGVYQQKDTYGVTGTTLTFSTAPPAGTDNIEVVSISTLALGQTSASLVSITDSGNYYTSGNVEGALQEAAQSSTTRFVQAGTNAVTRSVQDKARDRLSVKDFGAVGNGSTNDTTAVQNAINAGSTLGKDVYFPAGTYMVTNLYHGSTALIGESRTKSIIKAISGSGDSGYLLASGAWNTAGERYASTPTGLHHISLDGSNARSYAFAARTYFTTIEDCFIYGATDTNLLFSSDARDGSTLLSSMVNNVVKDCWIGYDSNTAQYNIRTVDSLGRCTDYHVVDNYFSGVSNTDLVVSHSAGWLIQGNHFYGAKSANIQRPNIGTRFVDNYCEAETRFSGGTNAYDGVQLGPGNFFLAPVWFDFLNSGNTTDTIVSVGNNYASGAEIRHNYFDPSKIVVSRNDLFAKSQPFAFYSADSAQDASTAIIRVENCVITPINRTISVTMTGGSAGSGAVLRRQNSWNNDIYNAIGLLPRDNYVGYYPRVAKRNRGFVGPSSAISLSIAMPDLGGDDGYRVTVFVTTAQFHSGPIRTTYKWEGHVVKKAGTGTYHFHTVSQVYTAGEWTVAPSLSASLASGTLTLTFAGTVATTDGYGHSTFEVIQ